jgi:hypothetical protein
MRARSNRQRIITTMPVCPNQATAGILCATVDYRLASPIWGAVVKAGINATVPRLRAPACTWAAAGAVALAAALLAEA